MCNPWYAVLIILVINHWEYMTGDTYCTHSLPPSGSVLVWVVHFLFLFSTTLHTHTQYTGNGVWPLDRLWHTRVLAEDRAMGHKEPLWVWDCDNIRKGSRAGERCLQERERLVKEGPWNHLSPRGARRLGVTSPVSLCRAIGWAAWTYSMFVITIYNLICVLILCPTRLYASQSYCDLT